MQQESVALIEIRSAQNTPISPNYEGPYYPMQQSYTLLL